MNRRNETVNTTATRTRQTPKRREHIERVRFLCVPYARDFGDGPVLRLKPENSHGVRVTREFFFFFLSPVHASSKTTTSGNRGFLFSIFDQLVITSDAKPVVPRLLRRKIVILFRFTAHDGYGV